MRVFQRLIVLAMAGLFQFQPALAADAALDATRSGKLETDLALITAGGVQLTGAQEWLLRREPGLLMFDAPEGDAKLALVELEAPDAAAAIAAAWSRFRPDAKRVAKQMLRRAARNGWDEKVEAVYEPAPNEGVAVEATALRSGATWTVAITEGATKTVQKRGAALRLMQGSMRPKGYKPESFAGRKPNRLDAARIARLRAFLAEAMKQLRIPGAAFALLENGKIVHEGGIGVRQLGRSAPVDANTLFMAASNTKSMTTLLLATLADDGKLRWDQPVTELYPGFKLGDAATTAKVRFKHLVCACTGLPQRNLEMMFEFGDTTALSSIGLLATDKPTSNFGELYQYSNLMASAAGYIGGALAHPGVEPGAAYDKAMRERIFAPLGMHATTLDMDKALRGNHASPHTVDIDNKVRVARTEMDRSIMPHRPAGGAWTSAHDFIRYVQLEANEGRLPDGRQLVTRDNLLARRLPQVAAGETSHYGMGLEIERAWGLDVVTHGGSLPGYKSNFFLLPEAGIGAVILVNADDGMQLIRPFLRRLVEELYDARPEAAEDVALAAEWMHGYRIKARAKFTVPADQAVARKLAPRYRSAELGALAVTHKGGQTYVDTGEWKAAVATIKHADGSVALRTVTPGLVGFEFVVGAKDGKRALIVRDGQHEHHFIEEAAKIASSGSPK